MNQIKKNKKIKFMNVFEITGVSSIKKEVSKEIGALGFYSDKYFDELETEKINIIIERNGSNNTNITTTEVNLRDYILALTYGKDAIASFPASHYQSWKTAVLLELCEGGNVELNGSDKIIIELNGLDPLKKYVMDGVVMNESNDDISDIIRVEEKIVPQDQKDVTVICDNSDVIVIDDIPEIKEINLTWAKTGNVTKHSMRELRLISVDDDPIAYVRNDGKTYSSYLKKLQIDSSKLKSINVVKDDTVKVVMLLKFDVQMQNLGLIKS